MKYRKLLCVAMVLVLLLGLSGSGLALTLDTITTGPIGTITGIVEEKIYSKATLEDDFADDRVLVVLNNAASLKLKTYTAADFPEIQCASVNDLSTAAQTRVSAKLKGEDVAAACGAKSDSIVFSDFYEVDVQKYNQILCLTLPTAGKQNVLAAMKLLMQREDVMYAGPDYYYTLCAETPNDTAYDEQWAPAKIQLPQAWEMTTGKSSVRVGVLDSGIRATHEDLSGRVLTDKSRDFVTGSSSVTDPRGHGTHVAGIIGAIGDNGKGIAGTAWNIRLISLRVFNENGMAKTSHLINAIDYAMDINIPILNFSGIWTILHGVTSEWYNEGDDTALRTAIAGFPGLFVCSAGNNGGSIEDSSVVPAVFDLPNLITVGSSDSADQIAYNSNYGETTVDIFAPGVNIYSTYNASNSSYTSMSGTSMAAPYVTGVAALMLSECSALTAAQIKTKILANSDFGLYFFEKCVCDGRLNAYKAVSNAHTFTGYTCTTISHTHVCACGGVTEPHTFTGYTHTATTHKHICVCGGVTEPHTFTQVGVQYVCIPCGYMTTSP